jgi:hypothetical protein
MATSSSAPPTAAQVAAAASQLNSQARTAVLSNSIEALQLIFSQQGMNPATQSVVNIAPRNVGLIRGFYVNVGFQFTTPATLTWTRTKLGPANLLQLLTFNDLSNQQRINVAGWYLPLLDTQRRRFASFASMLATGVPASQASGTDTPLGFEANALTSFSGASSPVMSAPATLAAATTFNVDMWYYVPISYTDRDLRGAIYAAVVNSVMNLQVTFNANNFFVGSTSDPTLAGYQASGALVAPTAQTWSVQVYQDFLDQLPFSNQGPVLPFQDLSWSYLLNSTFFTGMSVGQDFPIPFPNYRNIQSATLIYDNAGVLNPGTDLNYVALQSANYTNIFKVSPAMQAIITRANLKVDMPAGSYYFDFRKKPLSTVQYGNLSLIANPSSVGNTFTPQFLVGFEQLAQQNQVVGAGSIAGG